jgi:outer membrane protein assembly factor BamD
MQKGVLKTFINVLLVLILTSCASKFVKLQKKGTNDEKYKAAVEYYKQKDYYRASLLFEELIPILKGAADSEMAQFYNAYCTYHQKQYETSAFKFKAFYEVYARSPFAEEANYMYVLSLYKDSPSANLDQTNTVTAIEALQNFVNSYPKSTYSPQITNLITELRRKLETKAYDKAKLYYKTSGVSLANYKAAVIAVTNFERDFPDSDYNEELFALKVQSQYELAINSFETKEKERFQDVMKFYEEFIDKYPNSKSIKGIEKHYTNSEIQLKRIAKEEEEKKKALADKKLPVNKQ